MADVSVRSDRIHYKVGIGNKPAVLFVHGSGGSAEVWSQVLAELHGQCTTIAPDLPGHNRSQGQLLTSIGAMADWIADFLDALEVKQVVLAGHSMGGAIVQEFVLRYSERVLGLVLIGTGARLRVSPSILDGLAKGQMPFTNPNHLFSKFTTTDIAKRVLTAMGQTSAQVYYNDFRACNNFDRLDQMPAIQVPTQIIVGREDRLTPVKFSQYLQQSIPGARLTVLEGAGHMCMYEKPVELSQIVAEFWRDFAVNTSAT